MAKNKKTKKNTTVKALAHSGLRTSSATTGYGSKLSKPMLSITGIAKNGPIVDTNVDTVPESGANDERLETEGMDDSIIREPINLGVKNVRQILDCIKDSTLEVKDLILNECNIIYECKICLNLFRSLANFIAHKRCYCKQHFCERMLLFDSTHFQFNDDIDDNCEDNELEDEDLLNEEHVQTPDPNIKTETEPGIEMVSPTLSSTTNSLAENISPNKDQTIVSEKCKFIENCVKKVENEKQRHEKSNQIEVQLTSIKTNTNAVFQSIQTIDDCNKNIEIVDKKQIIKDLLKNSRNLNESQDIKRQKVEEILPNFDNESDLSESPANDCSEVKCDICDSTYTSTKTLKVHIKTIHSSNRLVYPCPLCSLVFKQLSNATRHLIQVHKRSKGEANQLKEVMKKRAYSTNSSENSSEVEDLSDEEVEEEMPLIEERISYDNKSKCNTRSHENSKPSEKTRKYRPCVYNCGQQFDWAPAKRSHEKSCRKRQEMEVDFNPNQCFVTNGSSHSTHLSQNNNRLSFQTQSESNSKQELSTVPNHTSNACNPSTNLILPNSVEERIKEFADLKSLRCNHCPSQDFMNLNQLLQHAVIHIGYSIYKCHGCSYHSIYENDMKYHLINNHNINEDMIGKHYRTLPNLTQPRLEILPINSANGSVETDLQSPERNQKLKIHLRTMGNTSKKCYEIVDK